MNFQITCRKTIISDTLPNKPSTPSYRHNTFDSINKQTLDIYNDHNSCRKARHGRYKSIAQTDNQNNFAQISALNVQNIFAAVINKQINRKNSNAIQQLTKSLNGTWFKSTVSQTCQFASSCLYTTLAVRKKSKEKPKKNNPETEQQILQKQYKEPNIFPVRPVTSLNLYSNNLNHKRKLAIDHNAFRSVEVQGRGFGVTNQKRTINQRWLKGQIIKNVTSINSEQNAYQKKKASKSRVKFAPSLSDPQKCKQDQDFVLISKKVKLNQ